MDDLHAERLDNVPALVAATRSGTKLKYLLFWGHTPADPAAVGKECLSQWYPAPFNVKGVTYPSAEHYMMAAKAHLFGDERTERAVLACTHPGEAKRLGRQVAGFSEDLWMRERESIVNDANLAKFAQHPDLRSFLLGTANRILVEASPHDAIWGVGLAANDPRIADPASWQGLNLLGFALMRVRDALRSS